MEIRRGDIFYANLSPTVGSEQSGIRPVLIIQNDVGNKYSTTVICLAITSKVKKILPTHVSLKGGHFGLLEDSIILAEQVRTIDKKRIVSKIGSVDEYILDEVKKALKISFNLRYDIFKDWN